MDFSWDEGKRARNIQKHGVDFLSTIPCFFDDRRVVYEDRRWDYGESRFHLLALLSGRVYHIISTRRGEAYRIISAWKVNKRDRRTYEQHRDDHQGRPDP